jgi:hypothetical protein
VHARALLASTPQGACDYVDGDVHDPEKMLADAARTLDLAQPVALMLLGILHHVPDLDEACSIVRRLAAALAPGSFLVINHSTSAVSGAAMEEAVRHWNQVGTPSPAKPDASASSRRPPPVTGSGHPPSRGRAGRRVPGGVTSC